MNRMMLMLPNGKIRQQSLSLESNFFETKTPAKYVQISLEFCFRRVQPRVLFIVDRGSCEMKREARSLPVARAYRQTEEHNLHIIFYPVP